MRTICIVLASLVLSACDPATGPEPAGPARADSLVLERSPCFGFCPAYRLSLRADGSVTFTSRNPGDATRTAADTIPPDRFRWLLQEAGRIGFFRLPPVIADDRQLCPVLASDHPTVTVTVARADSVHRVVDYTGCHAGTDGSVVPAIKELRHFEVEIDSVAQSQCWVRPPDFGEPRGGH